MNKKTRQMVFSLNQVNDSNEWYPTTPEIIEAVKKDYQQHCEYHDTDNPSVLDCGAGDGRVLNALTNGKKYAIEKERPLLDALDKDIFVVGTQFREQILIDKQVDILFCNPPFSEYVEWASKIIKEAHAGYIYLVIPSRWKDNKTINDYLKLRMAKYEVIGNFDFLHADRAARAKVDILRICLNRTGAWNRGSLKTSPFDIWFEENFKLSVNETSSSLFKRQQANEEERKENIKNEVVEGSSLVNTLEKMYHMELNTLMETYQKLCEVDSSILNELDVNVKAVREALQLKIENLKDNYWKELFDGLHTITDKLTDQSRNKLLGTLTAHTHVDFTASNAHAIVIWVIKNSNIYLNDQLIETVKTMTEHSNVALYKSNMKTYGKDEWRYCRRPDITHYQLDYRVVLSRIGGLSVSTWNGNVNGLDTRAAILINDLCTIAANLNYNTAGLSRAENFRWYGNSKKIFEYRNSKGEVETLFEVRAFKNGNLHIRFNSKFICRLNVEFGRLMGWVKNAQEAAEEMNIPLAETEQAFASNLQLTNNSMLQLGFSEAA